MGIYKLRGANAGWLRPARKEFGQRCEAGKSPSDSIGVDAARRDVNRCSTQDKARDSDVRLTLAAVKPIFPAAWDKPAGIRDLHKKKRWPGSSLTGNFRLSIRAKTRIFAAAGGRLGYNAIANAGQL